MSISKNIEFVLFTVLVLFNCGSAQEKGTGVDGCVLVKPTHVTLREMSHGNDILNKEFIMGHFDPSKHGAFRKINKEHTNKPFIYLHAETYSAFIKMDSAASKVGVELIIRSATRNFEYQKGIWERKWSGETKIENGKDASLAYPNSEDRARSILKFSSMPGTSRHHWGTDIDLNSFDNAYFETGEGLELYKWLTDNASTYGFCQVYTEKSINRPNGYEEEKWHWSYVPISKYLTQFAKQQIKDSDISGFKGSQTAVEIKIVDNYILGINQSCISQNNK